MGVYEYIHTKQATFKNAFLYLCFGPPPTDRFPKTLAGNSTSYSLSFSPVFSPYQLLREISGYQILSETEKYVYENNLILKTNYEGSESAVKDKN